MPTGLVGIQLKSERGFRAAIDAYVQRHGAENLRLVGNRTAAIPEARVDDLLQDLRRAGRFQFSRVEVRSMGDLSPEEAAALRASRGRAATPELADRKKVLHNLKRRYARMNASKTHG